MASPLELAFRRAAKRLIDVDQRWVAAVSGGADSIALLHLLSRLFRDRGDRLIVAHLDHGLRRGSVTDRRFVARRADELGLESVSERREVNDRRRRDESLEEAARRERRDFLERVRITSGAHGILTGHTIDDQAETVLMRLARGAGPEALTGIAEEAGRFVRPLLGLERAALRDWLEHHQIDWREDPSNKDRRFDRNRLRMEVVPLLERALNPRAARNIASAAATLREDAAFLNDWAEREFERLKRVDRAGRLLLSRTALRELPPVLARRVSLFALQAASIDPRRITRRHLEALIDLAEPPGNRLIHLPQKKCARIVRDEIRLE